MVTQPSLCVDQMSIKVNKNPESRKNRTHVENTDDAQDLRTDFTKTYADMSTSLHPIVGPRFCNTNHMSGIRLRRAPYGYWSWLQKSLAAVGGEVGGRKRPLS